MDLPAHTACVPRNGRDTRSSPKQPRDGSITLHCNSLSDADLTSVLHPCVNARLYEQQGPAVLTGGEDIHVTDEAGSKCLEALAGLWRVAVELVADKTLEWARAQGLK